MATKRRKNSSRPKRNKKKRNKRNVKRRTKHKMRQGDVSYKTQIKQLLKNISRTKGNYTFQDLGGNIQNINLFKIIPAAKEGTSESVFERIKRSYNNKNIRIFRRCYPDISTVMPENIPENKFLYKGFYQSDQIQYNRNNDIEPHYLPGFEMYSPLNQFEITYKDFPIKPYVKVNIPEYSVGDINFDYAKLSRENEILKGKIIHKKLGLYRDKRCVDENLIDDLIDVTDYFKTIPTILTYYMYDEVPIPFIEKVNGIEKFSPSLIPIDMFYIYFVNE